MTEKRQKILSAALRLFAEEGSRSASTSRVAREAAVSEALIFRHFGNKEGLLQAVIQMAEQKARHLYADIVLETDPKAVIRKTLEIALKIRDDVQDAVFWKLQYKIKWEMEEYAAEKLEPLELALSNAFRKLNYPSPTEEARLLLVYLDGLATRYFLQHGFDIQSQVRLMLSKYDMEMSL